jgi:hypothetical protein
MKMTPPPKLSKADKDALDRALKKALASDEPGRREQIEGKLHDDWFDAASFAAYHCQVNALD